MSGHSIITKVEELIAPVVDGQGVELYDLEYVKEGPDWILRLYIDKEGGVGLTDCERVSRAVEVVLDEQDPIPTAYLLEVSSPGIERSLKKDSHFARYVGERVDVKLYKPVEGRKKFRGLLIGLNEGAIEITDENGAVQRFDRASVASCKLVF